MDVKLIRLSTFINYKVKIFVGAYGCAPLPSFAVYGWYHEQIDPSAETAVDIAKVCQGINPEAAKEFVRLYIGEMVEDEE